MKKLKHFVIPLGRILEEQQNFTYAIDKTFFEYFNNSEIQNANLNANVKVRKQTRIYILDFSVSGTIFVQCDRCLDFFDMPLSFNQKVYLKIGNSTEESDYEIIVIPENINEFNFAKYLNEFILLNIPIRRVHGSDENGKSLCNKQMLNNLTKYVLNNQNDVKTDPRWDKLKDLI